MKCVMLNANTKKNNMNIHESLLQKKKYMAACNTKILTF